MGKAIIITGYPGTGKTSLARALERMLKSRAKIIEVDEEAKKNGWFWAYDARRRSHVYDTEFLEKWLVSEAVKSDLLFIFSIFPCLLPMEFVSQVFVLKSEPEVVERRLRERGWEEGKIRENLEAMEMGELEGEAEDCYGREKVKIIDTSGESPEIAAEKMLKELKIEI